MFAMGSMCGKQGGCTAGCSVFAVIDDTIDYTAIVFDDTTHAFFVQIMKLQKEQPQDITISSCRFVHRGGNQQAAGQVSSSAPEIWQPQPFNIR